MCRVYGFVSNESTKVDCSLVHAQNAMLHQSRADLRGKAHPDGWGIVCYGDDGLPQAERRATAAHEDIWFSVTAERTYSRAIVAHIRKATVGKTQLENTHPFVHGCWTFAHNGTVAGFAQIERQLEGQTAPGLLRDRKGATDSELVFYWLLTRMERAGLDIGRSCAESSHLVQIVSRSVARLDEISGRAVPDITSKLNFLLTDGQSLLAVRWNHTLFWVEREGIHDCEICGIPHVRHQTGTKYRAVVVASEPISQEAWREIPNHTIVVADRKGAVNTYVIAEQSAAVPDGELPLRS